MVDSVFIGRFAVGLADIVEEHGQPQDQISGSGLYRMDGVLPAAPAVPNVIKLSDLRVRYGVSGP